MKDTQQFMGGALDGPEMSSRSSERKVLHRDDYAKIWLPIAGMLAKELIGWIFSGRKKQDSILDRIEVTGDSDYPLKMSMKW